MLVIERGDSITGRQMRDRRVAASVPIGSYGAAEAPCLRAVRQIADYVRPGPPLPVVLCG